MQRRGVRFLLQSDGACRRRHAMELRDAVDQITRIRTQLAATEELRSLSAFPVLVSVAAALAAAVVQILYVPEPLAAPVAYLALWSVAALCGAGAAALAVAGRLGLPWSLARVFWLVPRPLRDWVYDQVAKNRYRWFGRKTECLLPTPALRARFLDLGE